MVQVHGVCVSSSHSKWEKGLFSSKTKAGTNALGRHEEEDIDVHSAHESIKRREKNSWRIRNGFVQCPNYTYPEPGKSWNWHLLIIQMGVRGPYSS